MPRDKERKKNPVYGFSLPKGLEERRNTLLNPGRRVMDPSLALEQFTQLSVKRFNGILITSGYPTDGTSIQAVRARLAARGKTFREVRDRDGHVVLYIIEPYRKG